MKMGINRIKVVKRIRKEVAKIEELAMDIIENGLLNPVTVMEMPDGEYQLLAGLRRLKAMEELGCDEIDVNIVTPANAEAALRIEISENEQREPFTFSEKMDFARMLEEIEREKARERKSLGGKGGLEQDTPRGAYLQRGETREIVAEKIGMGKTSYDRAKYISENAPDEVIAEIDRGKRSIRGAYEELRAKERDEQISVEQDDTNGISALSEDEQSVVNTSEAFAKTMQKMKPQEKSPKSKIQIEDYLSEQDKEAVRKIKEFNAMSPEEKIEEFRRQLKFERTRATIAESELAQLKEFHNNAVYHKDGIIDNLRFRLESSDEQLTEAFTQMQKCENCKNHVPQTSAE